MKIISIISLYLIFGIGCAFSQNDDVTFYVKISDESIVPLIKRNKSSEYLEIRGKSEKADNLFKKYNKIKKFELAFPTSVTPFLKDVYIVMCSGKELAQELTKTFPKGASGVSYLEYELTMDYADDYALELDQNNILLTKADKAWKYIFDLPKVPVAITDTYFDLNHEDLSMTLVGGSNTFYNSTSVKHGTLVAGCASAITNNNIGIASVGYDTELSVSSVRSDDEVLRLAQAGYRVINCSWMNRCSYDIYQDSLYMEIRNIWDAVVVFGAGNQGSKHCGNNNPAYPACYDSNVAVTSIGHYHSYGDVINPTNWENVHENTLGDSLTAHKHHPTMDICAPGYRISTTTVTDSGYAGGNYIHAWGTSFAAPQVSGALCLIFTINPCLSADEAVDILLDNADPMIYSLPENAQYLGRLGTGKLDVNASVLAAIETATEYLEGIALGGPQEIKSNYAIKAIDNVLISGGADVSFITRKEVIIQKNFEVELGAEFTIDVNVNNTICN